MGEPCIKEGEIAGLQSDVKTIFKRMDEQLEITKAVYDLTSEIRVMNNTVKTIQGGQEQLKKDVEDLKSRPGKRWDLIVSGIIGAIITGLVAFIMVRAGLK
jgi:hypothetical protein